MIGKLECASSESMWCVIHVIGFGTSPFGGQIEDKLKIYGSSSVRETETDSVVGHAACRPYHSFDSLHRAPCITESPEWDVVWREAFGFAFLLDFLHTAPVPGTRPTGWPPVQNATCVLGG